MGKRNKKGYLLYVIYFMFFAFTKIYNAEIKPECNELKLKLQEDLIIKESETDENYMFYRVSDISDIGINSGNCRVQKFDKNRRQEI